jgi:hypothetical protein
MRPAEIALVLSFADSIASQYGSNVSAVVLATVNFCHDNAAFNMPIYAGLLSRSCRQLYQDGAQACRMTIPQTVAAGQGLLERRPGSKKQLKSRPLRGIAKHLLHVVATLAYLATVSPHAALDLRTTWKRFVGEVLKHCGLHDRNFLFATLDLNARAVLRDVTEAIA